jgi:hypothetical protein
MKIEELTQRTRTLAQACIKVSILLPSGHAMSSLIKEKLLSQASELASKTRGLGLSQSPEYFASRLNTAADAANACGFWLEFVRDEKLMDVALIIPLIDECNVMLATFLQAAKKAKDKME